MTEFNQSAEIDTEILAIYMFSVAEISKKYK